MNFDTFYPFFFGFLFLFLDRSTTTFVLILSGSLAFAATTWHVRLGNSNFNDFIVEHFVSLCSIFCLFSFYFLFSFSFSDSPKSICSYAFYNSHAISFFFNFISFFSFLVHLPIKKKLTSMLSVNTLSYVYAFPFRIFRNLRSSATLLLTTLYFKFFLFHYYFFFSLYFFFDIFFMFFFKYKYITTNLYIKLN